jgi:hypothetical protein
MILEKWALIVLAGSPYDAPETWKQALTGEVQGHPRFKDGDFVTTSSIVGGRVESDNIIVTTKTGSEYLLGVVDPLYEIAFPDARARMLAVINKRFGTATGRAPSQPNLQQIPLNTPEAAQVKKAFMEEVDRDRWAEHRAEEKDYFDRSNE